MYVWTEAEIHHLTPKKKEKIVVGWIGSIIRPKPTQTYGVESKRMGTIKPLKNLKGPLRGHQSSKSFGW